MPLPTKVIRTAFHAPTMLIFIVDFHRENVENSLRCRSKKCSAPLDLQNGTTFVGIC